MACVLLPLLASDALLIHSALLLIVEMVSVMANRLGARA